MRVAEGVLRGEDAVLIQASAALVCLTYCNGAALPPPPVAPAGSWEACSEYDKAGGKHYINRKLVPIDCGGGWLCMTDCTLPIATPPST